MFRRFYPGEYMDSTYIIDFEMLFHEGYRGVLFDIDNTLVEHGVPADDKAIALFEELRSIGFKTCAISNNRKSRVQPFADKVGTMYVSKARKPSTVSYVKAMGMMNTDTSNTLFVGDQIFTDIRGANKAGIRTILVKPISKKEEIQIVLKRYLEKIVLYFMKKRNKREN